MYINHEKKFAFVEMRSVEEASNAMALDGIVFEACLTLIFSLWGGSKIMKSKNDTYFICFALS